MGVFADKLNEKGYDTFKAEFTAKAIAALQRYPHSVVDAWRSLGEQWGFEFMRGLMADMRGPAKEDKSVRTPLMNEAPFVAAAPKKVLPYQPRPKRVPLPRHEAIKKLQSIIFGYKLVDGRDIGELGVHQMDAHIRDGVLLHELKKELPVLSGKMQFANLNEIISKKQFEAARARAKL